MSEEQRRWWCYVAEDPAQPGTAWAAMADMPQYVQQNADEIADWIRKGAHVQRVPTDKAWEMLLKWVPPKD